MGWARARGVFAAAGTAGAVDRASPPPPRRRRRSPSRPTARSPTLGASSATRTAPRSRRGCAASSPRRAARRLSPTAPARRRGAGCAAGAGGDASGARGGRGGRGRGCRREHLAASAPRLRRARGAPIVVATTGALPTLRLAQALDEIGAGEAGGDGDGALLRLAVQHETALLGRARAIVAPSEAGARALGAVAPAAAIRTRPPTTPADAGDRLDGEILAELLELDREELPA